MNKVTDKRAIVIAGFVVAVLVVYLVRLFYIQVIDDSYKLSAIVNSQHIETQYPARGLIYDRNEKLLVYNQAAYDLMFIPGQLQTFDTTFLTSVFGVSKETLKKNIEKGRNYSRYKPSVLISQITDDKYARFQEQLHNYNGFFMRTRTLRKYNVTHSADVFGYIGEVNQNQVKNDTNYVIGDYIGINGLEKNYEEVLRGKKGKKVLLVDNHNRIKGAFEDGKHDVEAVIGENITATLDIDLQEYAYQLMQNKKGGIIAIEPASGEILLKVSSPGYDPALLVGLERGSNYRKLQQDPALPLFDRAVTAAYPPGSIFKTVVGLIGLEEGVITPSTRFECNHGGYFKGLFMRCHYHPTSSIDLRNALKYSCNPYFVNVFRRTLENDSYGGVRNAYDTWRNYLLDFGMGQKICPDFTNESSGSVPTQAYYDRLFNTQTWYYTYFMSLAIGQGELLITPLQMANIAASIANRGYYITPHIVRPMDPIHKEKIIRHDIPIKHTHFSPVIEGMEMAVKSGTAMRAKSDSIVICGKTGSIQNPHGEAHSAFIAFAPKENPKIAILVYVENGEGGSRYAAPIAGLLIEKYLLGKITEKKKSLENEMFQANLIAQPLSRPKPKASTGQEVLTEEEVIDEQQNEDI